MKLSWKVASLAALSAVADGNAFVSSNCHARPSSSLGMVRRGRRSMLPPSRSFLAPSQIFREMDQMLEDSFSTFDSFFDSPLMLRPSTGEFSGRANRLSDFAVVRRPRPTYELNQDDEKVELVVNVPGAKAEDINVDLEQNGRVIRLSGVSKVDEDGVSIESRFEKAFMLGRYGEKFDEDNITAKMTEGVLTITAPKLAEEVEESRKIMITEEVATALPEEAEAKSESEDVKGSVDMEVSTKDVFEEKSESEDIDGDELDEDAVIEL